MSHNIGQLFAAMLMMKTTVVWLYLPALLAGSVLTGALTGLAAQFVVSRLPNLSCGEECHMNWNLKWLLEHGLRPMVPALITGAVILGCAHVFGASAASGVFCLRMRE